MRRTLAAAGAVLALAAPAAAQADVEAEFEVRFTTEAPGAPSGLRVALEYLPDDPAAKPPAIEGGAFVLPSGTVIHNDARPKCDVTDAELYARGRDACPADTLVGVGEVVAVTGFGPPADPFNAESLQHNAPGHILANVVDRSSGRTVGFDRLTIEGSTLVAHPPAVPGGPPDGRTAIKRVEMNIPAPAAGTAPYVTTPPTCPADGLWRAAGEFRFSDGSSARTPTTIPCRAAAAAQGLAVRVAPAAVRAGRRSTFRVRVSAADAACERGVAVTIGRARATTGPDGRAVLRKHLSRTGRVTVRASKPGCGKARAKVSVVPAR